MLYETAAEEKEATEDKVKLPDDLRTLTVYPEPIMSNEQVRHGGFLLYVFGKFYYFEIFKLTFIGNGRNYVRIFGHITGDARLY